MSQEQFDEIVQIVEQIDRNNISVYLKGAREIQAWMQEKGTTKPPRSGGKDLGEEEKRLGLDLRNIRSVLIKAYNKLETEEEKRKFLERKGLTQEQFDEIVKIIDEIDKNNIPPHLQNARKIKAWMEEKGTTKPPRSGGKDLGEEEQRLGTALLTIKKSLIKPYSELETEEEKEKFLERKGFTQEQFDEIKGIIEEIDRNNISLYLQNAKEIQRWMEEKRTTKPPSATGKNEGEKRLGRALSTIRQSLIKPYNKLETEAEREKFLKRKGLSQEQFDEIVGIVEEIDKNNPRRRRLQEAKDARDEAERLQSRAKVLEGEVHEALAKKKGKTHDE